MRIPEAHITLSPHPPKAGNASVTPLVLRMSGGANRLPSGDIQIKKQALLNLGLDSIVSQVSENIKNYLQKSAFNFLLIFICKICIKHILKIITELCIYNFSTTTLSTKIIGNITSFPYIS